MIERRKLSISEIAMKIATIYTVHNFYPAVLKESSYAENKKI